MNEIKMNCKTSYVLPLEEINIFPAKLKCSSMLQIEELKELILKDGFCFPIGIGKLKNKNYVVDGNVRLYALQELENEGYKIPEVPVYYVEGNEDKIKRLILASSSIFHIVTKNAVLDFCKTISNTTAKEFSFPEGELIDFFTVADINRYFEIAKANKEKGLTGNEDYYGLFTGGEI